VNVAYDAAPPWPGRNGTYRMACVARLEAKAKGQDILLEVLSQDKWRERPIEVNIYGTGPNRNCLIKLKEMYKLQNVTFKGFTPDVEEIWREHHALVLSSRYEGLPLVIVEAMLCGRPCIVTDVAGNAELLSDNVTGFVAEAPTITAMDEALERAWERRTEWKAMGEAAAEQVRQLIPRDAAEVFAAELIELTRSLQASNEP
jgi:glycosyltransferase involved in cell wall biosynthesis